MAVLVFSMMPVGLPFEVFASDVQTVADSDVTLTNKWIYYENDFESGSTDELLLSSITDVEIRSADEENHTLYIPHVEGTQTQVTWNYHQTWDLGPYTVFELDICTSDVGTLQIYAYGENGGGFRPAVFRTTGVTSPGHDATKTKLLNHETVHVAVAINSVDNTYSVWFDGTCVNNNGPIADSATGEQVPDFGDLLKVNIRVTDGTDYSIDNFAVYDGLTTADRTDATPANPQTEEWLTDLIGTKSPVLDYGTEARAIIDEAGATMVNADVLSVYQNGEKRQATKSEVEALLAANTGKTFKPNDYYGLVIISDSALDLTDEQMNSLQNYMLYTRPLAQDLQDKFRIEEGEHPRLIINQDKLDQILADYKTNPTVEAWANNVIATADDMLKEAHVSKGGGRTIRDRGMNLSMAYLLTGDTKYKDFLWTDLELAGNFDDWSHKDSLLTTSDFTVGFAVAYDWLYDYWTEEERTFLEETLYDYALFRHHRYMYGKGYGLGTFFGSDTNRNAVCNGGMGLASIALFDVYPTECADILEKTYHMLEYMLGEFAPDGASVEGPSYWEYEMRYLVPFMASTELAFGSDFNIYETPGFDTTADYYLDIDGMDGMNTYHDAIDNTQAYCGELFWFSGALGRNDLTEVLLYKMDNYSLEGDIYSLIYYNSEITKPDTIERALDKYYKNVELVTMRSSWVNKLGNYVSVHSGKTNVSHAHIDSGSFVLDIGGQRFGGDIGQEDYNLGATGDLRYYYYRCRPEGHNVFVINPSEDIGQNIYANEVVSEFDSKPRGAYAILPLDSAYSGYATGAKRGIMLGDDRSSVLIRDEITGMTNETNEVVWFMQMENVETTISEDGKSAILTKNGVDVHVQVASDNATDWRIEKWDAETKYEKEGLVDAENETVNENWTRLAIVFTAGKDLNINVKFAELGDTKGDTAITQVALADWAIEGGELSEDYVAGGACGTNVNWTLTADGTLTISGDGAMADYASGEAPWYDYRSEIKAIDIKSHVTSIGKYAFYNCTALTSVTIPGNVATIGQNAFRSCAALTDVVICNGVATIDAKAFISCPKLARISIPVSVTNIGQQAFYSCKAIATVSYCGTDAQWKAITISTGNDYLTNVTRRQHSFVGGTCQSCGEKVVAYTVTWIVDGVETVQTYQPGETPVYPNDTPTKKTDTYKYTFSGWDVDSDGVTDELTAVTGNVTYTAVFDASIFLGKQISLYIDDLVRVKYNFRIGGTYDDSKAEDVEYVEEHGGLLVWMGDDIDDDVEYVAGTETYNVEGLTRYATGAYTVYAEGVPAKMLGDKIIARGYVINKAGEYEYTDIYDYNAVTYAQEQLAKENSVNKNLMVAMLNYGAAAQVNFDYNTDNLMNSWLTDEQKSLVEYSDDQIAALEEDVSKFNLGSSVDYTIRGNKSLDLNTLVLINIRLRIPNVATADMKALKLLYWSEEQYNAVETLTLDNVTKAYDLEYMSDYNTEEKVYKTAITGIAPKDMDDTCYTCVYIEYNNGTASYVNFGTYSIHEYARTKIDIDLTTATEQNMKLRSLCQMLVNYSYEAKQRFG